MPHRGYEGSAVLLFVHINSLREGDTPQFVILCKSVLIEKAGSHSDVLYRKSPFGVTLELISPSGVDEKFPRTVQVQSVNCTV